jgi:hypothetical protein
MTTFAIIAAAALLYFAAACFVGRELKATGDAMNVTQERWEKPSEPREPEVNVLALVKGTERYVFLYDDAHRADTLRTLGRYASDPELSFTWYDAALLSQKIAQGRTQGAKA